MSYTYNQLTAADLPVMHRLLEMFGEAFDDPRTYRGAVPSDAYLTSLLGKPQFVALAALDGERVVGGLGAYLLDKFELRVTGRARVGAALRHPGRSGGRADQHERQTVKLAVGRL